MFSVVAVLTTNYKAALVMESEGADVDVNNKTAFPSWGSTTEQSLLQ